MCVFICNVSESSVFYDFCSAGLFPYHQLKTWILHVNYAAGFYREEWTKEDINQWQQTIDQFFAKFQLLFRTKHNVDYPKNHCLQHLAFFVDLFGAPRNWEAMAHETVHKPNRNEAYHTNKQGHLEPVLMKRVN